MLAHFHIQMVNGVRSARMSLSRSISWLLTERVRNGSPRAANVNTAGTTPVTCHYFTVSSGFCTLSLATMRSKAVFANANVVHNLHFVTLQALQLLLAGNT
jgi:hypothetical protein